MNELYIRIFKTFSYGILNFLTTFINKYLFFPLVIFFWGNNIFNEWILITNISLHFSFFDFGSKIYLGNKLAKKNKKIHYYYKYLALTNTITLICIILCLISILYFYEFKNIIKDLSEIDFILVFIFSTLVVFLNIIIGNYGEAILRPLGLYYKYQKIDISFSLIIALILILSLIFNAKILTFTVINFFLIIIKFIYLDKYLKKKNINVKNFLFKINSLSKKKFKIITINGFFFYLGNIVNLIQTSTLILFGSIGMGINKIGSFIVHKTLSNLSSQISNLIALSFTYEYTKSINVKENERLIYYNLKISNYISLALNFFLILFAEFFFNIWMQNQIFFEKNLLIILIISTVIKNFSSTIANFLWAKNKQIRLNLILLIISLITIPITYILSINYGQIGLGYTYLFYEVFNLIIVFIFFTFNFKNIQILNTLIFESLKIIFFIITILSENYLYCLIFILIFLLLDVLKNYKLKI